MAASKVIASRTEEEIFAALGLRFVEPKDREVRW
jgi:DNA polymerase/3'-5' exonuclease PolX